ncbi:MAG: hypothetical protein ACRER2_05830 [Methylococcales bacterium]
MTNVKDLRVRIVDADMQFREQVYNFLLLEGYTKIAVTGNFTDAWEKIKKSSPCFWAIPDLNSST